MASNPTYMDVTLDTWNLAASSVTSGVITRLNPELRYYITYVVAGSDAPTNDDRANTPSAFDGSNYEAIGADAPIDIYIWAETNHPDGAKLTNCLRIGI